ncbi:hypothetical protein OPS25_04960 [Alteromonas ponticola]|uniref:Lipoprotein n=1 Tax=Alteromonas aquimaris TaxID=2998417 RepID=A0ABT3P502_9ALTE|nr:hypothetical protein [Alteromonas aquimaris]MCW8107846.1 hypothetical protein [Alteromonas aquimaris]
MKYICPSWLSTFAIILTLTACSDDAYSTLNDALVQSTVVQSESATGTSKALTEGGGWSSSDNQQVIKVVTTEYAIEAPDEMKMGWVQFEFTNKGDQVHFVAMYKLVDGKNIEDQKREVVPAFGTLMEGLRSGELRKKDIGSFLEKNIPEWGLKMTWVGGAGLLSPGRTTHATFKLDEPGTYLLECYVKAPDGQWHTLMGMLKQVIVSNQIAQTREPSPDWEVTLTDSGLNAPAKVKSGKHTIKVNFAAKAPGFMPYDINLAKLSPDTNLEKVFLWMDWTNIGGLRAPAPVEFLGGVEHMNAGKHGYIMVNLEAGRYLWVSEVNANNMYQEFMVE